MALTVNFTTSQTPGSPGDILFADASTGTDGSVTQRRIYIQPPSGSFLVEPGTSTEYEVWSGFPGTTTITLEDILDKDYACRVVVQWLNSGGSVLYEKIRYIGFTCWNEDFDYSLTQRISGNQLLLNDKNFWGNKKLLQTLIESGDKAIERNSDIASAQICYNEATNLRLQKQFYFNQSA